MKIKITPGIERDEALPAKIWLLQCATNTSGWITLRSFKSLEEAKDAANHCNLPEILINE